MERDKEKQLVMRAATDPETFGELYDHYFDRIFNYVVRSTYDVNTAQDITAETFFKALRNIKKFKFKENWSFQAWLYRIASNEINQYYRKNKKYKFVTNEEIEVFFHQDIPESEVGAALKKLDEQEQLKKLQSAIEKLPEKYQNALRLRYFEGKDYSEISTILNIKEATLRSQIKRGLDKLRAIINLEEGTAGDKEFSKLLLIAIFVVFSNTIR